MEDRMSKEEDLPIALEDEVFTAVAAYVHQRNTKSTSRSSQFRKGSAKLQDADDVFNVVKEFERYVHQKQEKNHAEEGIPIGR